jgi:hypothetical protein
LFLGKLAAKQNLSGVVVKLARASGEKAKDERTRATDVVTRGGKAIGGGRFEGWQKRRKEMNRINAAIHRGRMLPMWGYEFVRTTVNPAGTFALENLKAGPWFGPWFFVYEEPTGAPTIVGPVTITSQDRTMKVDIAIVEGGTIEGRVENVPTAMAGQVWVIAFDARIQSQKLHTNDRESLRWQPVAFTSSAFRSEGACHRRAASKIANAALCGSASTAMRPIFSIVMGGIWSVAPRL